MKDTPQRDNLNATPKPLAVVFVMQKDTMTATCELWTHVLGWECRLLAPGGREEGRQDCQRGR